MTKDDDGVCYSCDKLSEQIKQLTAERDAIKKEWEKAYEIAMRIKAERDKLKAALEKLACLGNGDAYGNSIGNCIAQEALKELK